MDIFDWEKKYIKDAHVFEVDKVYTETEAKNIVADFKAALNGEKIVLWGAGTVGSNLYRLLKEFDILVSGVVDRNGKNANFPYDIEILSTSDPAVKDICNDALIIVTVNRNIFSAVKKDIAQVGISLDRVICGHYLTMITQQACCMTKAYDPNKKLSIKNCYECTNLDNACWALNQYLKRINGFVDEGKGTKSVRMIGYALSNICNLRCRNCCESVPYMPANIKHFVPTENVIRDIDKIASACNFLTLLEFIGGEPFLHQGFPKILNHVKSIKNIGVIHIFSNGTVLPSDELCKELANERIAVYLSNYKATLKKQLLDKREETINKLHSYGINFLVGEKMDWKDFSGFELVKTVSESYQTYDDCFLHNCNRTHDGVLYVCPHQYAGIRLKKLKELPKETIHIHDYTSEELAFEMEAIKSLHAIDACQYCTMPHKAKSVPSGEQLI